MSRSIPWTRILVEGVVIVFSILLAFAIDAWGAEREAEKKARRELAVVVEELREGRHEIEVMGRWHGRLGDGIGSLATILQERATGAPVHVPDTLLAGAVLFPVTDPPTAVLNAFLGSGHLERLRNERLRRGLANWRALVDDMRGDELRGRNFEDSELMPYLRAEFDMVSAQEAAMAVWLNGLDGDGDIEVRHTQLRATTRLNNLLARQVALYRLTASQSSQVLESLDALVLEIEQELGMERSPPAVAGGEPDR